MGLLPEAAINPFSAACEGPTYSSTNFRLRTLGGFCVSVLSVDHDWRQSSDNVLIPETLENKHCRIKTLHGKSRLNIFVMKTLDFFAIFKGTPSR